MMIKHPCKNLCTLNRGGDYCKGCHRSVAEARDWNGYTEARKKAVIQALKLRAATVKGLHTCKTK